jgi:hypothetical protein
VAAAVSARKPGRRLVLVWVVLAALLGAILYAERADLVTLWNRQVDVHGHSGPRDLVVVPLDELGAVEIVYQGTVHRFERDAGKLWFYHGAHAAQQAAHEHQTDPAAAERIEKALAAFMRTRIERHFMLDFASLGSSPAQRELSGEHEVRDYGVRAPSMIVLLYLPAQIEPAARYAVGDVAPDSHSRYVQRLGSPEVVTIPNYQIENLQQLIASMTPDGLRDAPAEPVRSD